MGLLLKKQLFLLLAFFTSLSLLFLFLVNQPVSAAGNNYYVATNGSDSNPGTINNPWKTIQHSVDQLQPGDTLLVRGGVYLGRGWRVADISTKASASSKITVKGYPGETAILRTNNGWVLEILGASYWIFEDLTIERIEGGGWCGVRIGDYSDGASATSSDHLEFRRITFQNTPGGGVCLQRGNYNLFEDSKFLEHRRLGMDAHGILTSIATGTVIRNNYFKDSGGDGVHIGWRGTSIDTRIEDNIFVDTNQNDSAGENGVDIKKTGGTTWIKGNVISGYRPCDVYCDGASGTGMTIHQGATNVIVDSNVFFDNDVAITLGTNIGPMTVKNNLFFNGHIETTNFSHLCRRELRLRILLELYYLYSIDHQLHRKVQTRILV